MVAVRAPGRARRGCAVIPAAVWARVMAMATDGMWTVWRQGCANCLSGLKAGLHGKLASMAGAFHKPKISWFIGAGGPVPITPGYVPYIVTTRSPRDFFCFPPMNPNAP